MATNISFSTYGFMNGILILSEENWRRFFKPFITDSVQNGLATIAGANMTVYVSAGECRCGAVMGILDEMIALDIANGDSTYDRIDSVIVQYTYGEPSTLAVAIIQGTPSANPVPPTLTKVYDTLWQMEIAQILVPSGATSSSEFTITDKRVIYESIESIIDDNTESEERVWSSQKTHEEIVSLSTEIYDSLNTKADAIERTTSGDIVTITDGADNIPIKELVVGIEPVQDLNGYDTPWSGGANVNVFPGIVPGTYSNHGITAVVDKNGLITVTGQKDTSGSFNVDLTLAVDTYAVPENYYVHLRNSTIISNASFNVGGCAPSINALNRIFQNTSERTPTSDCRFYFGQNTPSDELNFTLQVSVEATNAVTDWTPYANICPITGWSEAKVTRMGKNLAPVVLGSTVTIGSQSWSVDANGYVTQTSASDNRNWKYDKAQWYTFLKPGTYKVVAECSQYDSTNISLRFYNPSDTSKCTITISSTGTFTNTFTITEDTPIGIMAKNNGGKYRFALYQGTEETAYTPYVGTQVTIDLDGTRYGGTLNVLTGELTVNRGIADLGDYSWNVPQTNNYMYTSGISSLIKKPETNSIVVNLISDHLVKTDRNHIENALNGIACASNGNISVRFPDYPTSPTDFKTAVTGWKVVYPLATSLTVQLTPAQLSTMLGENNIWADTGNVSLTYRADTKKYIEQKVADTNRKTCEMMTIVTDKMVAPDNLAVGDLVIVNDDLYKVINSNIASGETMVVGTNVMKITLAEYIQSLI